ncbi:MAG TPA: non-heme iron oxygenase ferredoxin subunit [Candidatus Binatia bacterium]|nr:non-heme iron oxygenase ferredoxin subunit [Candidatus Binatia bacterium]
MATETMLEVISRQDWLDRVSEKVQPAVARALAGGGQPLQDFLNGVWLGHPLHPALTDVPLGSWTAALALDALDEISGNDGFGRGADAAVAVGLAGAAAVTGMADWQHLGGEERRVGTLHGLLNTGAALLYARSLALRQRRERRAGRGFALLGFLLSTAAAYVGGKLVYSYRVGVDRAAAGSPPRDFVPVMAEGELPENELRRVEVGRVPVLLVRRQGRIFALAEACSHLSGPLAEGRLEGDSVVCPWHGSRFALGDGRVLNGPATHPQPCFEARVHDGRIEVRAGGR